MWDRLRTTRDVEAPAAPPAEALEAQQRFLAELTARVVWHEEAAYGGRGRRRGDAGAPTLWELEQLVERHARGFPERAPVWRSHLFAMRAYADADGRIPEDLSELVESTFDDLLALR